MPCAAQYNSHLSVLQKFLASASSASHVVCPLVPQNSSGGLPRRSPTSNAAGRPHFNVQNNEERRDLQRGKLCSVPLQSMTR